MLDTLIENIQQFQKSAHPSPPMSINKVLLDF